MDYVDAAVCGQLECAHRPGSTRDGLARERDPRANAGPILSGQLETPFRPRTPVESCLCGTAEFLSA